MPPPENIIPCLNNNGAIIDFLLLIKYNYFTTKIDATDND